MRSRRLASWLALGILGTYLAEYAVARRTGILTHFIRTVADIDFDVRHVRCLHRIDPPPLFLPEGRLDAQIAALYRPIIATELGFWAAYRPEWTNRVRGTRCGFPLHL